MSGPRPERGAGDEGPYAQGAYEADGTFVAAIDQLADPLTDPLPGQRPGQHASPWFRAGNIPADGATPPAPPRAQQPQQGLQGAQQAQETPREWYDPEGYERDWYRQAEPVRSTASAAAPPPGPEPGPGPDVVSRPAPPAAPVPADDETVGLRTADVAPPPRPSAAADGPRTQGRAERRKAAKGRGRRRTEATAGADPEAARPAAPMSRVEARRAARAAKDSPAVVASRVVGEVFISLGVLMLLFVTYQLWWTNIRADLIAGKETNKIQDEWASGERRPGVFEPGRGFAIMHIPKLDVVAPIAEGIDKEKVLDRGMIGHYGEGKLKTAMPSAKQGNFSVAGHRNTHGEPFRYINKLLPGDPIVVETQDAYYTYEMTSILPQTSPSNVSVIAPVPAGSGFTAPGRYLTLTTCTPEFTSTYRLIVWGKMVDERPRSKGKPDALVG
ncbi:class E sortase [Streptomyces finlayi]|uniref:Class E sortase n=1 Tax=Streptomyces finlayi TaxID=67296 RepID=A0A7G7BLP9_9ACTN|nr:class E sortase [Streptomyces finlayi]QNE76264.1 class E sortase [Streptomyces finlayi]